MIRLPAFLKTQKQPSPEEEVAYIQGEWDYLKQPLSRDFVIRKSPVEYQEYVTTLLELVSKHSAKNPKNIDSISEGLLRQIVFTSYYADYHQPQYLEKRAFLGELEQLKLLQDIDDRASLLAQSWIAMFEAYGAKISPGNLLNSVHEEMRIRGLLPPTLPVQPAQPAQQSPTPVMPTPTQTPAPVQQPKQSIDELMRQTQIKPEGSGVEYAEGDALHRTGLALAAVLSEKLSSKVEYLPEQSSGSEICYGRMVFQLDRKTSPAAINDNVMVHALSLADFEPDSTPYQVKALKSGRVAIDLPVYSSATPTQLLNHLVAQSNSVPLLESKQTRKLLDALSIYLKDLIVLPGGHLRFLAGIDATGEPVTLQLIDRSGAGLAITGKSGCGKSGQILSLLSQICVALTPDELRFAALDFKGQAQTLSLAEDMPHIWLPPTKAEWQKLAAIHELNLPDDEAEMLWDEADLFIPKVAWKEQDAIAYLKALEREQMRRAAILRRYGLQSIFEYYDSKRKPTIPLLPICVEEGGGFSDAVGSGVACQWVHKITSQWRAYGMPIVETVQDGKADTALPPSARLNIMSKMLFLSSSDNVKRLIGDSKSDEKWVAAAARLKKQVDAITLTDTGFAHIHPFFVSTDHFNWVKSALKSIHSDWLKQRDRDRQAILSGGNSFSLPPTVDPEDETEEEDALNPRKPRVVTPEEEKKRFDEMLELFKQNEESPGSVSMSKLLQEVIGKYEYPHYPAGKKTASRYNNLSTAITKTISLAERFGLVLSEEEIRAVKRKKQLSLVS